MDTCVDNRLKLLDDSILDPHSAIYVDALLDSISAIVNEVDVKSPGQKLIHSEILRRFKSSAEFINSSRTNASDFTTVKTLGKGAFGEVFLVRLNGTNDVFAMKRLDKFEMINRGEVARIWEEREIMALSNSDWIVKIHYAFQDASYLYMVMDFIQGGDMVRFMETYETNEEMARFYVAELCLAVDTVHMLGFIHRDIKPDNMLVDKNGHLKLCDFGTCIRVDENGKVKCETAVGTCDYMSPEVLISQKSAASEYGKECDWWAVGVFLYEFLTCVTPFYSESFADTYTNIINHQRSLKFPPEYNMSGATVNIIKGFLTDADKRLGRNGIEDIKNHSFFDNQNWKWDNIRTHPSPVVPDINDTEDTSHFDEISIHQESCDQSPRQEGYPFSGNHMHFIGFSYQKRHRLNGRTTEEKQPDQNDKILVSEIADLKKKLEESSGLASRLEIDKKKLMNELIEARKKIEVAVREAKTLKTKHTDLMSTVNTHNKEINEIKDQLSSSQEYTTELQEKLKEQSELILSLDLLKGENTKLLSKIKDMENESRERSQTMKDIESQLSILTDNQSRIKNENVDITNKLMAIQISYKDLESLKNSLECDLNNANSQIKTNMDTFTNLNIGHSNLKTDYSSLVDMVNEIKIMLGCDDLASIKENINSTRVDNRMLISKLKQQESQIIALQQSAQNGSAEAHKRRVSEEEYACLQSECETLRQALNDSGVNYEMLSNRYDKVLAELKSVRSSYASQEAKVDELDNKVKSLSLANSRFQIEQKETNNVRVSLTERINNMTQISSNNDRIIIDLKHQLHSEEMQSLMRKNKIDELTTELSEYENKVAAFEKTVKTLSCTNERLAGSASSRDRLMGELKLANSELTDEIERLKEIVATHNKGTGSDLSPGAASTGTTYQLSMFENENVELKELVKMLEVDKKALTDQVNQFAQRLSQGEAMLVAQEEGHKKELEHEKLLKNQAVKKLTEITDSSRSGKLVKYERLNRQLQQQLKNEQERNKAHVTNLEQRINELNMIVNSLNGDIYTLKAEATMRIETDKRRADRLSESDSLFPSFLSSLSAGYVPADDDSVIEENNFYLSAPRGKSPRKLNWQKYIGVLTKKRFYLYKDESSREKKSHFRCIELRLIQHCRAVTQNDLIHASEKEVLKCFHLIYGKSDENEDVPQSPIQDEQRKNRASCFITINNHNFLSVQYHLPTLCDHCGKGLWGLLKMPSAYECSICRMRCHKEHVTDGSIPACKANIQKFICKDIIVMANSTHDRDRWLQIFKKIGDVYNPVSPNHNSTLSFKR